MKSNNNLKMSFMPLILMIALAIAVPQQDKKDSQNKGKSEAKKADDDKKNNNSQKGNDQGKEKGNQSNGNNNQKSDHKNDQSYGSKDDHSDKGSDNKDWKIKRGNGNSRVLNGNRDIDINWDLSNFAMRRTPKNQKKISICHKPGASGSGNPVNISISENALNAHLNHGDQIGNCSVNYSDRWSDNYIKSREGVYTVYEQTYETMTYSEALLKFAAEKLLGIRTNLNTSRVNLSSQEVERREMLILDLQNNVTSLEDQLQLSRQKVDSDVNIIVQL
ncbi:hypothetical protein SAMN05421813_11259 [Daejeonella rubra]|uniref:Uncharacterized protein n=1 Tax=Daejeonella rubra TaxID=990371 RepID=A0A1G9T8X1_9SPHI|nr:hypothetical protein [Daejeonella rubra]SDM44173.1 hypothetical protein SAMN05421813_11259 [Daejeonella rubra]